MIQEENNVNHHVNVVVYQFTYVNEFLYLDSPRPNDSTKISNTYIN